MSVYGPPPSSLHTADRLAALWEYLLSWTSSAGAVNGPVVHRGDLKRMVSIHDTAWTQAAVIEGLLNLFERSEEDYWLCWAARLCDVQCRRLQPDGSFARAGHEDTRSSGLVHNALADCALLRAAPLLQQAGDPARAALYLEVAERNLRGYLLGELYRSASRAFVVSPRDPYTGTDTVVLDMNSVAVAALASLDRARGSDEHASLLLGVGEILLDHQAREGPGRGGFAYSDHQPDIQVSLYVGLATRGLPHLAKLTGESRWRQAARGALDFLGRHRDPDTGLWWHLRAPDGLRRFPLFIAGAGMIGDGILDAAEACGEVADGLDLASCLLSMQYPSGAIPNFRGYDHADNQRVGRSGGECWEDALPTPNWNAQAFRFLSRVLPPPTPPSEARLAPTLRVRRRFVYLETRRLSLALGTWPPRDISLAAYLKPHRFGVALPQPWLLLRRARRWIRGTRPGRLLRRLRRHLAGTPTPPPLV